MKKPLSIAILSYVAKQPASAFPIQEFTNEDADGTPEECFRQIAELEEAGLLSAAIARDNMGRPFHAVIRGMTVEGRNYLAKWTEETISANPFRKATRWTRDMIFLAIGIVLGGALTKLGELLIEKLLSPQ
jgi:hypothetical protein